MIFHESVNVMSPTSYFTFFVIRAYRLSPFIIIFRGEIEKFHADRKLGSSVLYGSAYSMLCAQ